MRARSGDDGTPLTAMSEAADGAGALRHRSMDTA